MLSWIIQITVISIILIFLVHHLINFLKSTLTVPKIKDLVNTSNKRYENMYDIIHNNSNTSSQNTSNNSNTSNITNNLNNSHITNDEYHLVDLIPKKETSMKNELKNFLKKQLNTSSNTGTDITALDSMSNLNSFSLY
jgi:hypothetical protein